MMFCSLPKNKRLLLILHSPVLSEDIPFLTSSKYPTIYIFVVTFSILLVIFTIFFSFLNFERARNCFMKNFTTSLTDTFFYSYHFQSKSAIFKIGAILLLNMIYPVSLETLIIHIVIDSHAMIAPSTTVLISHLNY